MTGPKDLKGQRVGRYTLLNHLASGGMAEIFLASHEGENGFAKELVLKILQARYADNPDIVRMFFDEARMGAKLNHPNIVDVYESGVDNGLHYIAMEYISGKTLTEVIRRGIEIQKPLPLDHAAYLVAETAAGLAYMHDGTDGHGRPFHIVHRDISPSNLLISFSGQTKIIDFGIAHEEDADTGGVGARPGKVSYMSPEQVKGANLDGRSDIFSLGTILYEITLGRRLWRGPKEVVMRRIVEEKPAPPTYVDRAYPPALELVVLRALEKRPDDRYATAAELFEDLEAYLVAAGARTRNHQIAQYLHELFATGARVSEMGMRLAKDFTDDEVSEDVLDFDRPAPGAGKAFADALRASGRYVPLAARPPEESSKIRVAGGDAERAAADELPVTPPPVSPPSSPSSSPRLPVPLRPSAPVVLHSAAPAPAPSSPNAGLSQALDEGPLLLPKPRRFGVVIGVVLACVVVVGLLLALGRT